jgi:hypothetical protein
MLILPPEKLVPDIDPPSNEPLVPLEDNLVVPLEMLFVLIVHPPIFPDDAET